MPKAAEKFRRGVVVSVVSTLVAGSIPMEMAFANEIESNVESQENALIEGSELSTNTEGVVTGEFKLSDWTYDDKTEGVIVLNTYKGTQEDIIILGEVEGKQVSITKECLSSLKDKKSITIKETNGKKVKLIGDTSLDAVFKGGKITSANLEGLDVSTIVSMKGAFEDCSLLANINVSSWDVKSVKDMSSMFARCNGVGSVNISGWKVSEVTTMESMFAESNATNINLSSWKATKLEKADTMFANSRTLVNVDLSGWDAPVLKSANNMFMNSDKLELVNLSGLSIKEGVTIVDMFKLEGPVAETSSKILVVTADETLMKYDYKKDGRKPSVITVDPKGGVFEDKTTEKKTKEIYTISNTTDEELWKLVEGIGGMPTKENFKFGGWQTQSRPNFENIYQKINAEYEPEWIEAEYDDEENIDIEEGSCAIYSVESVEEIDEVLKKLSEKYEIKIKSRKLYPDVMGYGLELKDKETGTEVNTQEDETEKVEDAVDETEDKGKAAEIQIDYKEELITKLDGYFKGMPEIKVAKGHQITLSVGQKFDAKEGVIATDSEDGDITKDIQVIENTVDTDQVGEYEVLYYVEDKDGHEGYYFMDVKVEKADSNTTTGGKENPKTGDVGMIGYMTGMVASLTAAVGLSRKRK